MTRSRLTAAVLRPDRIREIDRRGFAFLPNAFLQDGFFTQLTSSERSLYLLYVLAADRNGVSFVAHVNLAALLSTGIDEYLRDRKSLADRDLIAFADLGTRVQVLSLPERAQPAQPTAKPATSRPLPKQAEVPVETPNHEKGLLRLREILKNLER